MEVVESIRGACCIRQRNSDNSLSTQTRFASFCLLAGLLARPCYCRGKKGNLRFRVVGKRERACKENNKRQHRMRNHHYSHYRQEQSTKPEYGALLWLFRGTDPKETASTTVGAHSGCVWPSMTKALSSGEKMAWERRVMGMRHLMGLEQHPSVADEGGRHQSSRERKAGVDH